MDKVILKRFRNFINEHLKTEPFPSVEQFKSFILGEQDEDGKLIVDDNVIEVIAKIAYVAAVDKNVMTDFYIQRKSNSEIDYLETMSDWLTLKSLPFGMTDEVKVVLKNGSDLVTKLKSLTAEERSNFFKSIDKIGKYKL